MRNLTHAFLSCTLACAAFTNFINKRKKMSLTNDKEMDDSLHNQSNISVKKTFFGLKETLFFNPTKSKIDGGDLELDSDNGDKIKELLELPDDTICQLTSKMDHLLPAENGMYDLSYCILKTTSSQPCSLRSTCPSNTGRSPQSVLSRMKQRNHFLEFC